MKKTLSTPINDHKVSRYESKNGFSVYVTDIDNTQAKEVIIHKNLTSASKTALFIDINSNDGQAETINATEYGLTSEDVYEFLAKLSEPGLTWVLLNEHFKATYKNREQAVLLQQIAMQEAMQEAGFNIVECGNCGSTLIHQRGEEEVECFCGTMDLSDCPDVYFKGMIMDKQ